MKYPKTTAPSWEEAIAMTVYDSPGSDLHLLDTGYSLLREIITLSRCGMSYQAQLVELQPLVKKFPELQALVNQLVGK